MKKYDLLQKHWKKIIFKKFFSKGGPFDVGTVEKHFFDFSKFQNFFLKNGLNGTCQMLKGTKSWNMSSIGASTEASREISLQGGSAGPPPGRIGLRPKLHKLSNFKLKFCKLPQNSRKFYQISYQDQKWCNFRVKSTFSGGG